MDSKEPSANNFATIPPSTSESKVESQQDLNSVKESQDPIEVEDLDHFIQELQRIIHETPAGMQARFARTINHLNQKRSKLIQNKFSRLEKEDPFEMDKIYNEIDSLLQELDNNTSNYLRFQQLMKITQLRETLSILKKKTLNL